jgi:integrase
MERLLPAQRPRSRLRGEKIRKFWAALGDERRIIAALFEIRLLTAQRAGDVHGATWAEMNLESGWWTVPADRAKNGLAHRVPLSPPALKILKDLKAKADDDSPWVVPSTRKTGLRRTAASLMVGAGVPRLVVSKS